MGAEAAILTDAPVSADLFRQGMRRLAGATTVITSLMPGEGRGGWVGMTATAVASVSADPARLLVCVNRSTFAHGVISNSGLIGVNVLGRDGLPVASRFAGGVPPQERFAEGEWRASSGGAPLLRSALASFDCAVAECITASTHDIFICDVRDILIRPRSGDPLIYFDGAFLGECVDPETR